MAKMDVEIKKQIVDLLEIELTIKAVCSKLNLSRQSVYRWIKEDKQFGKDIKDAIKNCVLSVNDDCEYHILKKIKAEDINAIKFWLKFHHPDYRQSYILTK